MPMGGKVDRDDRSMVCLANDAQIDTNRAHTHRDTLKNSSFATSVVISDYDDDGYTLIDFRSAYANKTQTHSSIECSF